MQTIDNTQSPGAKRNPVAITVVCLASLFLAYLILSRHFFPDNCNAVDRILNRGSVGWAGIGFNGVDPARIAALGVPCALEIDSVAKNGPADKAGLRRGDLIVGCNGKPFSDVLQLQGNARSFVPGQTITLNINRSGTVLAVPVTLCSWDEITQLNMTGGISL